MQTEIKKLEPTNIEIYSTVEWEEFLPYYEKALNDIAEITEVKGFRLGKAPKEIVEKQVGKEKVFHQAIEKIVQEQYKITMEKNDFEPIDKPLVEILKFAPQNPLQFKIKIQILPHFDLPDYTEIVKQIPIVASDVSEQEIAHTLQWIQQSRSQMEETTQGAQKGNWVEIEYQSPQIANNKVWADSFILGQGKMLAGFEEMLEGMKEGEQKSFTLSVPADYPYVALAGKNADFQVKMKAVKLLHLPELNDDFARQLGRFENLSALKENIKEGLQMEKDIQSRQQWQTEILQAIAKKIDLFLPQSLLTAEKERILADWKKECEKLKMDWNDYLSGQQKTEQDIEKEAAEKAAQQISHYLILRAIAKKENITVSQQEIEQEINNILSRYPQVSPQDIDEIAVKEILLNNKVLKFLENIYHSA
jgi:trigger factor